MKGRVTQIVAMILRAVTLDKKDFLKNKRKWLKKIQIFHASITSHFRFYSLTGDSVFDFRTQPNFSAYKSGQC